MAAHLESFSEEEKRELSSLLGKDLFVFCSIYISVILVSAAIVLYCNIYSENNYFLNNIEVINVVFVVISVICARMVVSEVIDYRKEIKSSHKKIVETKISEKKEGEIIIGNKTFDEDDFLFGVSDFDSFQSGEHVRIELSAISETLFSISRI